MAVSRDEVARIASLARLELGEADVDRMTEEMNAVLSYVEQLNEVDTGGVSPHSFLEGKSTPLQPDTVKDFDNLDEALAGAPKAEGTFFIVPRVIE